jgi:hypothetical protein
MSRPDGQKSAAVARLERKAYFLLGFAPRAAESSLPMRPCGPTTKGRESAFQLRSAPGASWSAGSGWTARQLRPSSVETSVPLGPTVIQVLVAGS